MLSSKLLSSIDNIDRLYVDDVFSAYTYTGNGSTQTINNGIDLAGKGGLVWIKNRTNANENALTDTARGTGLKLITNSTGSQVTTPESVSAFNANGFSLNTTGTAVNGAYPYVSWTFRKATKFFDVVTYTGNGASSRAIAHSLGQEVGMVMTKTTSTTGDWNTYHRSATGDLVLNTTAAQTGSKALVNSATTSTFTVSGAANTNSVAYVAYIFAHDTSADGIIQCGSFMSDGSGNATVNLGWEPQYLLFKIVTSSDWKVLDVSRGWSLTASQVVFPHYSAVEEGGLIAPPNSLGFSGGGFGGNATHIYLAIRRSNKPPTSGTEVYNAIARTGTGAAATVTGVGFAPDLVVSRGRLFAYYPSVLVDRLRGVPKQNAPLLLSSSPAKEDNSSVSGISGLTMDGYTIASSDSLWNKTAPSQQTYINHFFRRAPGFFDVVCDTGTGVAHGIAHGLSVAPEFVIRKSRSGATQWECWHSALTAAEKMVLNSTAAKVMDATAWNSTFPTSTQFTVGTGANVNTNAVTYVTYLFATLAGISKVGSYTGNGTTQTINCGFTTGAKFILIKRTDSDGDWFVWDTARGIVSANDPHLSLNAIDAEATGDDSVDPESTGFIVNQVAATNINVTSATYLYLAIS